LATGAGCAAVWFLDVGQGDAALLQMPDGSTAMIDAGDTAVRPDLVGFLSQQGIDHIDWWLPSHPHADHVGAFTSVLDRGVPVTHAVLSPQQYNTVTWLRQLNNLYAQNIDVQTASAGEVLWLDGAQQVKAEVLNPPSLPTPPGTREPAPLTIATLPATRSPC